MTDEHAKGAQIPAEEADVTAAPQPDDDTHIVLPSTLPVLPVRDIVVFNYMILPLYVGREKSIQAVDAALSGNRYILILSQKDEAEDDPGPDSLYTVGAAAMIMRMLKMPDGRLKILVQGLSRARVESFTSSAPFMTARIEPIEEREIQELTVEQEAMMRTAREQSERILSLRGVAAGDIMSVLNSVNDPGRLADLIASNLRIKVEEAQRILECADPIKRLALVNTQLVKEVEVADVQARIQSMAKEGMDKAQRDFFLREQLKAIRKELGESEEKEIEELAKALDELKLPKEVDKEARKQLNRYGSMHPESSEATVVRTYLDWIIELPWKKQTKDQLDIKKAAAILEEDHYDLEKVKERILEYLSVRKLNPKMKGPILCFVGPPGVGKTSLGRSIARAMGRKFHRLSLGGVRDEAEIRGHRRTYIGSMPGRIIQGLKTAASRNPVFMLDEVDKLGTDFRGDPSSALLEVLDPEQNDTFTDNYLGVPFDLSRVMFICTANMLETIPGPLLDRMETIRIPGYTEHEKTQIARRFLIPRQAKENGLTLEDVSISDQVVMQLIRGFTREAGMRNLERAIGKVCRKLARRKAEGDSGPFQVTTRSLKKLMGPADFLEDEKEQDLPPGVAVGLAWTPYGGEILHVEAATMPGKGKLILTGKLGEVMQESARAALSYAKGRSEELHIDPDFTDKRDIHIHVPSGATPKDGPSAGVALVCALVSALTSRSLASDLAMTGEITLRGRVLPVGGVKEKILAAVSHGLERVIIPSRNAKDLEEIPNELRRKVKITTVERIDELWDMVWEKD